MTTTIEKPLGSILLYIEKLRPTTNISAKRVVHTDNFDKAIHYRNLHNWVCVFIS